MDKTSLGDRMKKFESIPSIQLMPKTPVIIRLDGKAFHTLTRGMNRPFDDLLIQTMQQTTKALVENIEGCEFGYTQSDEISLLLTDYKKFETQAWFDYKVQKIVSIAASMCSVYFNQFFKMNFCNEATILELSEKNGKLTDYSDKSAFFDARAFNVPKEEVVNCFVWRQQDCTRNSIQMVGQANFSHKELHGKSCEVIQEMLWSQKKINWDSIETHKKRGACVYKRNIVIKNNIVYNLDDEVGYPKSKEERLRMLNYPVVRTEYFFDTEIPIFTQDRNFIQKWVDVEQHDN